jgi:hypothetical protein
VYAPARHVPSSSSTAWPLSGATCSLHVGTSCISRRASAMDGKMRSLPLARGIHSFKLQLNLSIFGTHSWVKLGRVAHKTAQVELKWERG